jgi:hypothetical protein
MPEKEKPPAMPVDIYLLPDIWYLMTKFLLKDCRPAPVFVPHGFLI